MPSGGQAELGAGYVDQQSDIKLSLTTGTDFILDWLRHEFGLEKPGQALARPHLLEADKFVAALRKALPKSRRFSAADIARLKQEHEMTLGPVRTVANEGLPWSAASPIWSTPHLASRRRRFN